MIGITAIALILCQCNLVSASGKCYSQMICTNGNSSEVALGFIQIHPPPECHQLDEKTDHDALDIIFDNVIERFKHDLEITVAEQCSSRNVTKPSPGNKETVQQQKCFVPVTCDGVEGAQVSWMQIRPYRSCPGSKNNDEKLEQYSKKLNQSKNDAVKVLERLLFNQYSFCRSSEVTNLIEEMKKEELKLNESHLQSDPMDCYAPATCQYESGVDLEWRKMPSMDRCSQMEPENVLDSTLKKVIKDAKEIFKTECPETCKPGGKSTVAPTTAAFTRQEYHEDTTMAIPTQRPVTTLPKVHEDTTTAIPTQLPATTLPEGHDDTTTALPTQRLATTSSKDHKDPTTVTPSQTPSIRPTGNENEETNEVSTVGASVTGSVQSFASLEARCYMGIKSGQIPNSAMNASSEFDGHHAAHLGRLDNQENGSFVGAWNPETKDAEPWIEVDFESPSMIAGVVTQGRPFPYCCQWVTSYNVSCGNTTSAMTVVAENGSKKNYSGNDDRDSKVYNRFPQPLTCRYFRIYPQTSYYRVSMRIEFVKGSCYDSFVIPKL